MRNRLPELLTLRHRLTRSRERRYEEHARLKSWDAQKRPTLRRFGNICGNIWAEFFRYCGVGDTGKDLVSRWITERILQAGGLRSGQWITSSR
jgi:hypothetical protein